MFARLFLEGWVGGEYVRRLGKAAWPCGKVRSGELKKANFFPPSIRLKVAKGVGRLPYTNF